MFVLAPSWLANNAGREAFWRFAHRPDMPGDARNHRRQVSAGSLTIQVHRAFNCQTTPGHRQTHARWPWSGSKQPQSVSPNSRELISTRIHQRASWVLRPKP